MITNQEQQLNIGVHNRGNDILIIFDCDGVLVDSEPIANRIIVQCFQSEGFNVDLTFADCLVLKKVYTIWLRILLQVYSFKLILNTVYIF
jgi:FMN phosphatase YigB (HAD superfamily)